MTRRITVEHGGTSFPGRNLPWTGRERLALTVILLLAMLTRVGAVFAIPSPLESDYLGYYTMASNLYAGNSLAGLDGKPTAFLNVGYSLFLRTIYAATGVSVGAGQAANVVLGVVTVLLVYVAARRLWGLRIVAVLAGTAAACYLEAIAYTAYMAKENLMIPLVMGLLVLATSQPRGRWWWLAALLFGILTGCLAIVGNAGLAMLPGVGLLVMFLAPNARQAASYIVIALLAAGLTITPLLWRNHVVFGAWVLNNNGGFNLYIGNNPNATPYFQSIVETPLGAEWQHIRAELGEHGADVVARKLAISYIVDHPGATVRLALRKAVAFWEPPLHEGKGGNSSQLETATRHVWLVQFCLLCALFVANLLWLRRGRDWTLLTLWLMTVGYTAVHMVFYVSVRYRLPVMVVLCVGAAGGALAVLDALRGKRRTFAEVRRQQLPVN